MPPTPPPPPARPAPLPALSHLSRGPPRRNSASCERVFALLKNLFGDQQFSALADYLESSLKLNYNKRRVG